MQKEGSQKAAHLISRGWEVKVRAVSGKFHVEVLIELQDEHGLDRDGRGGEGGESSKGGWMFQAIGTSCAKSVVGEEPRERTHGGFSKPGLEIHQKATLTQCPWVAPNSYTLVPYLTLGCPAKPSSHST